MLSDALYIPIPLLHRPISHPIHTDKMSASKPVITHKSIFPLSAYISIYHTITCIGYPTIYFIQIAIFYCMLKNNAKLDN